MTYLNYLWAVTVVITEEFSAQNVCGVDVSEADVFHLPLNLQGVDDASAEGLLLEMCSFIDPIFSSSH